eukprot:Skav218150  [mRNA]  locus=scaffold2428:30090:32236:- [translate_table: standard]
MAFTGTYEMCPVKGCGLVLQSNRMEEHLKKCDGQLRPANRNTLKNRRQTPAYSEASRAFLASKWNGVQTPFMLQCRCLAACKLNSSGMSKDRSLTKKQIEDALEEHYQAQDVAALAKEALQLVTDVKFLMCVSNKYEWIGPLGHCEADQKRKVAKIEENSQLISEQMEVVEVLLKETTRLKQELAEASSKCVICREEKPSRAFVPCGHVCVCASCWPDFVRNSGEQLLCPTCRQGVNFAHDVYL